VQALVRRAVETAPLPRPSALEQALARENKWQAIRYGLEAVTITASEGPLPIRKVILRTLEELAVDAAALGSEAAIAEVEQISCRGSGAERQLATFAAAGQVRAVSQQIVAETASS
jgi:carboxylate-amine ligase